MDFSYKNNFWGYFSFYYRIVGNRMFLYLALSVLISFMDGIGLAMFIPLLETVARKGDAPAGDDSMGQLSYLTDLIQRAGIELNITNVLIILVVLFVLKGIFKFCQLTYNIVLRQYFIKKIRFHLVERLEGLSYGAFLKLDAGKIQNTLTNEVARLFTTLASYFNSAQTFVMLATYIVLAFMANYQFALLVGVGSLISNLIYRKIYKVTQKASIQLSEKWSDFNSFLVQSIYYFKYLKSTNGFIKYSVKLKRVINETEFLNRKMGNMRSIAIAAKEPIIIIIVAVVIIVQVNLMGTNINTILLSLLFFYRALTFLVALQNEWQNFMENIGGMNAIGTLSKEMTAMQESKEGATFNKLNEKIHLKDIEFYYDQKKAIDKVNIEIPTKQTIALVGESGSGKTTLANMIAGLIHPNNGTVFVDETPLTKVNLASYRDKIGYISQESVIFNDNIYNNVTFWAEPTEENKKRFWEIIEMASLSAFIQSLPEKEETNLGDNGILISGGQKQRISIARELYKKAELLIFDEATSALDSETEKIIQENIEKLHGTYTMIVIAHRLSTIKNADTIYLLEGGRVTASGNFEEMVLKSNRFKKMVSLQAV